MALAAATTTTTTRALAARGRDDATRRFIHRRGDADAARARGVDDARLERARARDGRRERAREVANDGARGGGRGGGAEPERRRG